jgi:hypothetical protein
MLRIRELACALVVVGCADVNSVVGGACAEGYVEQNSACVPAPSTSTDGDGGLTQADGSANAGDGGGDGQRANRDAGSSNALGPTNTCVAPQLLCGNDCIDPTSDPNNCGSCGKVCPSNSCVSGKCVGSAPGHVVVIGHDYTSAPSTFSSQARVLSNAVLLPASNPLRVMSYEQFAGAAAVKNAEGLISAEAKQLGRSVTFVATTSAQTVSSSIDVSAYDVLLVHDQSSAPDGTLATIGSSWQADGNVAAFLHAGGVVVLLTGGTGSGQMPSLATNAQLLSIDAQANVVGSLSVVAPADAIGSGVVSPYVPKSNTVTFETEPNGGNVVWVVAQSGAPVVVHKVVP